MIKGIFTSGTALQPRMLRLEVLANNLANIETTGYKKAQLFIQTLQQELGKRETQQELEGLEAQQYTDFSQGSLRSTGNPLDFAIDGEGFFAVETPRGIRYTRNGSFQLSPEGVIVNRQGYALLGVGGRIQLPDIQKMNNGTLVVKETGEVFFENQPIGKVNVVQFENVQRLKKEGASLFAADDTPMVESKESSRIRQGYLEESNVEGIAEMVAMVELTRSFETDQKAIQLQDATLERAMDVGRV
jgi:flagellar basal-body rod protein FlgF